MKVIICGAGQVGSNIAHYLASEGNDVAIIDQNSQLIQKLSDTVDVQGLVGHAASPDILEQAGAGAADMVIAVTQSDETNMIACQVGAALFNIPTKVARIRNQAYLAPHWSGLFAPGHLPIDLIISPEIEVARAIMRRLEVPGAADAIALADGKVRLISVVCGEDCPILDTPLRQLTALFPDLALQIVAIIRKGVLHIPLADDFLLSGDEVYFVVDSHHTTRAMQAFGHEEETTRRVILLGGGNVGLFLAKEIEAHHPEIHLKLLELNSVRAQQLAGQLARTVVLCGDALDDRLLEEAGIAHTKAVVAATDDDETNILGALLARRMGADRLITLVNRANFVPLVMGLGIDAVVNPRSITVSRILQYVRRGRIRSVHSLREGMAEVIEAEVMETSAIANKAVESVKLPNGCRLGAVVREQQIFVARPGVVLRPKDRIIVLASHEAVKSLERWFSVRLEFF
jgi:trk system potassium uptake protein